MSTQGRKWTPSQKAKFIATMKRKQIDAKARAIRPIEIPLSAVPDMRATKRLTPRSTREPDYSALGKLVLAVWRGL